MVKLQHNNESKYEALVIAVATGVSVSEWCRTSRTSRATVRRWTEDAKFRQDVEAIRAEFRDEGLGVLHAAYKKAAERVVQISESSHSDAAKLAALKTILDLTTLEQINRRLSELEVFRAKLERGAGKTGS